MSTKAVSTSLDTIARARRRLRMTLAIVSVLICGLLAVVALLSYKRMQYESFLERRFAGEQFVKTLDSAFVRALDTEESRPFDHYSFFTANRSEITNEQAFQRSPLSQLAPDRAPIGLVGYFQVSANGTISSPILPSGPGALDARASLSPSEWEQREQRLAHIKGILFSVSRPSAVTAPASDIDKGRVEAASQNAPGKPSSGSAAAGGTFSQDVLLRKRVENKEKEKRVEDLFDQKQLQALQQGAAAPIDSIGSLSERTQKVSKDKSGGSRKEVSNVLLEQPLPAAPSRYGEGDYDSARGETNSAPAAAVEQPKVVQDRPRVVSFEAEIDPFQSLSIDDQHLILFRKAWRDGQRFIQGVVLRKREFVESVLRAELEKEVLPASTTVLLSLDGTPLFEYSSLAPTYSMRGIGSLSYGKQSESGSILLYQSTLREPLNLFTAYVSIRRLPLPPGAQLLAVVTLTLTAVILLGLALLYRLGIEQIELAKKRGDFVSAISHELKTPLTSIRMYGEMLKNDWVVDEGKRRGYYEYIFQESERLSRLINNVLQLSRLSTKGESLARQPHSTEECLNFIRGKVEQLISTAGFTLSIQNHEGAENVSLSVELDALAQIAINLVENAVKFSRMGERKEVVLGFEYLKGSNQVALFVRDFGPGVSRSERRKIFELFYRGEDELTRQTSGTGIGLALVRDLARQMAATVDYRSKDPGSEFRVVFQILT